MDEQGEAGWLKDVNWEAEDMVTMTQDKWSRWEEAFAEYFPHHTKAELFQEAMKREILLFPVNTAGDIAVDPQLKARNFWVDVYYPELDASLRHPGAPLKLSEFPYQIRHRAPLIGEHNQAIYKGDLGLSDDELAALKQIKAI